MSKASLCMAVSPPAPFCLDCTSLWWEVGREHWSRQWQPTPVFLPGKIPWTEEPGGLQSMSLQRVVHDWATEHARREQGCEKGRPRTQLGTLTPCSVSQTGPGVSWGQPAGERKSSFSMQPAMLEPVAKRNKLTWYGALPMSVPGGFLNTSEEKWCLPTSQEL